jgi:fluoroquinolone resistance protein
MNSFSGESFKGINTGPTSFPKGEYESCRLLDCAFTGVNLAGFIFSECVFENCDLSNAMIKGTVFRDVAFKSCKMLGLRFDQCHTFLVSFSFENCVLDFSSFYGLKIKQTAFKACKLKDVDFTEADVSKSSFHQSDLYRAVFDRTNISQSDFRTAYNFSINPESNTMTRAKFSAGNLSGLLDKYMLDIK